ncbi:MAG: ribbon-helix-helix protein, CopG family [Peptococcaceae bacterium]|nr:ribbon-helix-helix protein, CopG family [Peptococcaceae bacterium]
MAENKRIMISLPQSLLEEVDGIVTLENRNRSDFIREAIDEIIHERRKRGIREQMRKGYLEMAQLNLEICRELFTVEEETRKHFEKTMVEYR